MKKVVIGITVLALVLSLGIVAMAANDTNIETEDEQFQKNYELRKNFINQQLEKGFITKEQANYMRDRLNQMKKYYEENGNKLNKPYGTDRGREFSEMRMQFGPMMQGRGYGRRIQRGMMRGRGRSRGGC